VRCGRDDWKKEGDQDRRGGFFIGDINLIMNYFIIICPCVNNHRAIHCWCALASTVEPEATVTDREAKKMLIKTILTNPIFRVYRNNQFS
jgi:hypothetical protein